VVVGLSKSEKTLIPPVKAIIPESSEANSMDISSKSQKNKTNSQINDCVSIQGYHSVPLLKIHHARFNEKLHSYQRKIIPGSKSIVHHPKLSIQDVSKEVHCSFSSVSGSYDLLMKWIYVLHERMMNNFEIPIYMYRVYQEELLNWLDNQIFPSDKSDPKLAVIAISQLSEQAWPEGLHYGEAQLKLVNYFHKVSREDYFLHSTANDLLDIFIKDTHPSECFFIFIFL
jgi:hypothetical protein